jgi:predicted nucleic acid-binding protein
VKQRIYIDTSVVGGYFDEEFREATLGLFARLEANEVVFVISDLLDFELTYAPQNVRDLLERFSSDKFERVALSADAMILADKYIEEKVVGRTSLEDCRHIALATVNKVMY